MKESVKWYARAGDITKMGPYETQQEATAAVITTAGLPMEGAFIWAETQEQTRRYARLARDHAQQLKERDSRY